MIGIALVGAGYIGCIHAHIIEHLHDIARVVAVTDAVPEKGKAFSDKIGAAFYPNLETVLDNAEVDVVAVCSPTPSHEAYVTLAAGRGKHVFCEKPLAQSLDEADRMIEAVRRNEVRAMSGHVLRFWPVYVRTRELIASGEIGNPIHGYCERLIALPDWQEGGWHLRQKDGRAAAFDVQIHDLDYLTWLFGRPLKVQSGGLYDADRGGWMHMNTRVDFEGGRIGHVQSGWGFPPSYPFTMTIRILCEGGAVEWNFKAGQLLETRDRGAPLVVYRSDGSFSEERVDQEDPFLLQWRYFLNCIAEGRQIERATFDEGRTALKLALASIESAKKGGEAVRLEGL
jgi:UDP-N-acetylglucosamine 3-dehydrogenase